MNNTTLSILVINNPLPSSVLNFGVKDLDIIQILFHLENLNSIIFSRVHLARCAKGLHSHFIQVSAHQNEYGSLNLS